MDNPLKMNECPPKKQMKMMVWFRCYGPYKWITVVINLLIGSPFHTPFTLPKFNSSQLKSYQNPIGKDRLPVPPFFRGKLAVNFGGV